MSDCYSTAAASGTSNERSAGLIVHNGGNVIRCYSVGRVRGGDAGYPGCKAAGLIANNSGTVTDCYYDTQTSGQSDTGLGELKTTAQMKEQSTFEGWDFTSVWRISPGEYPSLRAK